jgi:spermidine synthase
MLTLNGAIAFTERDEFHLHEMLVHPVAQRHPHPRRALIIGGGDGGALRELLRYSSIERIDLIERDEALPRAVQACFPEFARGLRDPRVRRIHAEASAWLTDAPMEEAYDLIILDAGDPTAETFANEGLWSSSTLEKLRSRLSPQGFLAAPGGFPLLSERQSLLSRKALLEAIPGAACASLWVSTPTLPTGMSAIHLVGPENTDLLTSTLHHPSAIQPCRYYDPAIDAAAYVWPKELRQALARGLSEREASGNEDSLSPPQATASAISPLAAKTSAM